MEPTIYLSAGHNFEAVGAKNTGLRLKEHTECVKILKAMIAAPLGLKIKIVPGGTLHQKVQFINDKTDGSTDLAIELHLNACIPNQCFGMETLYYRGSIKGQALADCVLKGMRKYLPFRFRGIKSSTSLYFLKHTIIPAVIVEPFFLDNDAEASYLFLERSHEIIARSICTGIVNFI